MGLIWSWEWGPREPQFIFLPLFFLNGLLINSKKKKKNYVVNFFLSHISQSYIFPEDLLFHIFLNLRYGSLLDITLTELYLSWGFILIIIFDYFFIMVFLGSKFKMGQILRVKFWKFKLWKVSNFEKVKLWKVQTLKRFKFWKSQTLRVKFWKGQILKKSNFEKVKFWG